MRRDCGAPINALVAGSWFADASRTLANVVYRDAPQIAPSSLIGPCVPSLRSHRRNLLALWIKSISLLSFATWSASRRAFDSAPRDGSNCGSRSGEQQLQFFRWCRPSRLRNPRIGYRIQRPQRVQISYPTRPISIVPTRTPATASIRFMSSWAMIPSMTPRLIL